MIKFEGHKLINYNMLTNLVRKAEREKKKLYPCGAVRVVIPVKVSDGGRKWWSGEDWDMHRIIRPGH